MLSTFRGFYGCQSGWIESLEQDVREPRSRTGSAREASSSPSGRGPSTYSPRTTTW